MAYIKQRDMWLNNIRTPGAGQWPPAAEPATATASGPTGAAARTNEEHLHEMHYWVHIPSRSPDPVRLCQNQNEWYYAVNRMRGSFMYVRVQLLILFPRTKILVRLIGRVPICQGGGKTYTSGSGIRYQVPPEQSNARLAFLPSHW